MGETHSQPTKGKHTPQPRAFNRINYEIVCAEVIQHTTLHRDRKITELQKAEAVVRQKLSEVPVVGMDVIHEVIFSRLKTIGQCMFVSSESS